MGSLGKPLHGLYQNDCEVDFSEFIGRMQLHLRKLLDIVTYRTDF